MVELFVKDRNGEVVTIDGSPVIIKGLSKKGRKPRECQLCQFNRWCVNDTCFVITNNEGMMEWLCPNCAVTKRGLPTEYYKQNKYASIPKFSTTSPSLFDAVACGGTNNDGNVSGDDDTPNNSYWSNLASNYFCSY